ncbi:MAG: fatty acid desaturase [Anaerolineae bacterium]|nr:fatty acid desaturase [Anaerolineae bacterium]MBN8619364.1 fatty acid desaturase [Anaerolineae bacterium]
MESTASASHVPPIDDSWKKIVTPYQNSDLRMSLLQALTSIAPYFILWYLMYRSLEVSYWLTLLLAVPTAGFAMRMFIIFHDAGHGSFFKSKRANAIIGQFTGVLLFTPYYAWRHSHAIHHATAGDLDRRGTGDIWTLTVEEYNKLSFWKRMAYRMYRNPFVIFVIGPTIDFVVLQRFYPMNAATDPREKASVRHTNIALLIILIVMSLTIGFKEYVMVQLPIIAIASSVGVWLFYVQHQYENVYWERHENWDFATAALYGSSYYKLPRILQWFSGNIGFHHIHHLSPRIPNYSLEQCHNENELFQKVEPLTIRTSLKSLHVRLWDEDHHKLVGYHPHHVPDDLDLD